MENYGITDICECLSYLLDKDIICEQDEKYTDIVVWEVLPRYTHEKYKKSGVLVDIESVKHLSVLDICLDHILIYSGIVGEW